jgi:two-component system sensor histidine kinase QseC
MSTEPIEPATVAKSALLANERNAQQKDVSVMLTGDLRAEINAEPVLIGILLDNLIDNAIKYGRVGGRIEVAVRHVGARVRLTVSDDGPGVAASELDRLTHRFFRATGNQATGSGLGLSIVARIAEHFGANLQLGAGVDGRGLTVEVSFPAYSVAQNSGYAPV